MCVTANGSSSQSSPATSFSESSPKPPRRCMSSDTSHASDYASSTAAAVRPSYQRPTHQGHSTSLDRSSTLTARSAMSGQLLPVHCLLSQALSWLIVSTRLLHYSKVEHLNLFDFIQFFVRDDSCPKSRLFMKHKENDATLLNKNKFLFIIFAKTFIINK